MSGYQSSDRFPPIPTRNSDKVIYPSTPIKTSLTRSVPTSSHNGISTFRNVPSYEELYSAESVSKPILKAYDIDFSIHIDTSTSVATPKLGKITCTFDEADAYRPKCAKDLPLIVKPLRQISQDFSDRRSRSSEGQELVLSRAKDSSVTVSRRRSTGGVDGLRKDKQWFSSSVDSSQSPLHGTKVSTLPKNFLRKPTVLHAASLVQAEAMPFIDDDAPDFPPPKPARSHPEFNCFPPTPVVSGKSDHDTCKKEKIGQIFEAVW
uniref:FCH domain only protein 2 n=1 Tax=Heterorhabditis bacteriophora TaxID=37862 RepID=A0A1I7XFD7_HETBA